MKNLQSTSPSGSIVASESKPVSDLTTLFIFGLGKLRLGRYARRRVCMIDSRSESIMQISQSKKILTRRRDLRTGLFFLADGSVRAAGLVDGGATICPKGGSPLGEPVAPCDFQSAACIKSPATSGRPLVRGLPSAGALLSAFEQILDSGSDSALPSPFNIKGLQAVRNQITRLRNQITRLKAQITRLRNQITRLKIHPMGTAIPL